MRTTDWETELFVLQGDDRPHLLRQVQALAAFLERQSGICLRDLAGTLNAEPIRGNQRLALVAGSVEELQQRLSRAAGRLEDANCRQIRDVLGIYFADQPLYPAGKIALLFPGEGAPYLGMLGDLLPHFPETADVVAQCDAMNARSDYDPRPLSRFLSVPSDHAARADREAELRRLGNTMFSVLMADWALLELVRQLEIPAEAMAGHSAGELAALWAAGCLDGGLDLAQVHRSMSALDEDDNDCGTVLLAVGASREALREIVEKLDAKRHAADEPSPYYLAMDNCPHQTVVVALAEAAKALEAELAGRKFMFERLPFHRPYHTPLFEPFMGPLANMFGGMSFQRPHTTTYSCTIARPFPDRPDEIQRLALAHWSSPVEFTGMVRAMYDDGVRIFIEVGPRGNLTAFVEDILRGRSFLAVPCDTPRRSALTQLNHLVAQLTAHHVPLRLEHLYLRRQPERIEWQTSSAKPQSTPASRLGLAAAESGNGHASPETTPPISRIAASQRPPMSQEPADPPVLPANPRLSSAVFETAAPPRPSARNSWPSAVPPATPPVPGGESRRGAVVSNYWQVMEQFLDLQHDVMQQYLRRCRMGQSAAPRATPPAPQLPDSPSSDSQSGLLKAAPPSPSPPVSHDLPMIARIVHLEAEQEAVIRRPLDLREDAYGGHHTVGGREVSHVYPERNGQPVMPMTFSLELMAEVATLLFPGLVVTAIRNVQLLRWLSFDEDQPVFVELTARVAARTETSAELHVQIRDLGPDPDGEGNNGLAAAAAVVEMADRYPEPPPVQDFPLSNERPCRIPLDVLYKNLFHGEYFQGVSSLDRFGDEGIQGQVRVLPRNGLFRSNPDPQFILDPVLMDVAMHPLAGWHLEQPDQTGRILLPYELKDIRFYGPRPSVGTEMTSQGRILHESGRRFTHSVDVIGPHGRLWCQMHGLKYWRFYLPFGEFNFHGPKDDYFLSESWTQVVTGLENGHPPSGERLKPETHPSVWCVKLIPPGDLQQPDLMLAAGRVTLSPDELEQFRRLDVPAPRKSEWLFGRLAAKDAVRHLWKRRHGQRLVPADLEIHPDEHGRPVASPLGCQRPADFPHVSITHSEGIVGAAASFDRPVGIDIERVVSRDEAFEQIAFDEAERQLLDRYGENRDEGIARFWCAREAASKALGRGLVEGPRSLAVREAESATGMVQVVLGRKLAEIFPELQDSALPVRTLRDGEFVVAAALVEESLACT